MVSVKLGYNGRKNKCDKRPDLLEDHKCLTSHLHGFECNDVKDLAKLRHEDVEGLPQVLLLDLFIHILDIYCVVWSKIHDYGWLIL